MADLKARIAKRCAKEFEDGDFINLGIGSALLTGISLCAPFWVKLYDILTEGFPKLPAMVNWLQNFGKPKEDPEDPEGNAENYQNR